MHTIPKNENSGKSLKDYIVTPQSKVNPTSFTEDYSFIPKSSKLIWEALDHFEE